MMVGSSASGWRGNGEHILKAGVTVGVTVGILVTVGEEVGVIEGLGKGVVVSVADGLTIGAT